MAHRGPDENGLFITEKVLSHERLSIVDLSTGKPIQGTTTAYMVHNGEIYNHKELRSGILKGHTLERNQTQVIVHLYENFGFDFVINWTAILLCHS
jgi:asparagine synthase (glutamine-hydrolysing)